MTVPGSIAFHSLTGHIPALGEELIDITFLPGVPSLLEKSVPIQVAHFEPDVIMLTGEAVFPQISFDTHRDLSSVKEPIVQ